jgi:4-hydroxy-3-methylbut-2-enyl diphosphate reductase
MRISIEDKSGFCYGVVRVIKIAEDLLKNGEQVWCLGQIVHNEAEVERLGNMGMKFIEHKDIETLHDAKLLIRAHGEPPSTYEIAKKNNLEIIEGTCPIVQKLQKNIKSNYSQTDNDNQSIIIFGKENHPEVIGLMGQTNNKAIVIKTAEEARNITIKKNVVLYSQTTMDKSEYEIIASILRLRVLENNGNFTMKKTICGHVSHRKPGLINFSKENDVIVFVGGKNSSNAKVLFEICRETNTRSHFISSLNELKAEWFEGAVSAGVCGATSTSVWQLEAVVSKIKEFINI